MNNENSELFYQKLASLKKGVEESLGDEFKVHVSEDPHGTVSLVVVTYDDGKIVISTDRDEFINACRTTLDMDSLVFLYVKHIKKTIKRRSV